MEERCHLCDEPTGRAGRDEDSLIVLDQPACENCHRAAAAGFREAADWLEENLPREQGYPGGPRNRGIGLAKDRLRREADRREGK